MSALAFIDRSWRHPVEFARFFVEPVLTDDNRPLRERQRAAEDLRLVFRQLASVEKYMLDAGDLPRLREADDAWSQILEHWEPEYAAYDPEYARYVVETEGADSPRAREAVMAAAVQLALATMKVELADLRAVHRLGLVAWGLHRLQGLEPGEEADALLACLALLTIAKSHKGVSVREVFRT